MCNCVRLWVPDPAVEGVHNSRPVTCNEYITALEKALYRACGIELPADNEAPEITVSTADAPFQHELKGISCSCGRWQAKIGETISRGFDRHLIAVREESRNAFAGPLAGTIQFPLMVSEGYKGSVIMDADGVRFEPDEDSL